MTKTCTCGPNAGCTDCPRDVSLADARQAVLSELCRSCTAQYPGADIRNLAGAYEILHQLS